MDPSFLEEPVGSFLERVAAREPAPGGGAVAAVTVASAAGLAGMAARFSSPRLPGSERLAMRADRFRRRALQLARDDASAYSAVLEAYALPREPDPQRRAGEIREALRAAAEVPLALAGLAAKVAELAQRLEEEGNPNLKGDAITAIYLAEAAARSAAALVDLNAQLGKLGPGLPERASRCAQAAARARDRMTTVSWPPQP